MKKITKLLLTAVLLVFAVSGAKVYAGKVYASISVANAATWDAGTNTMGFTGVPSYNIDKQYHPKEKEYVGYNILLNDCYYYIMGDTDRTPETDKVKTDVCFVPIGGTFTMNVEEAADYINDIKPVKAIPIHYGKIVGEKSLGTKFKNMVDDNIEVEVLIGD